MTNHLKAVLIGCGGISRAWLNGIKDLPGLEIVALVDLIEDNAKQRAEDFGLTDALIETDMVAAVNKTQPDMVFNCTVPEAHLVVTHE